MRQNVNQLADFYQSPLGASVIRIMRSNLGNLWADIGTQSQKPSLLGFGYSAPFLEPYHEIFRPVVTAIASELCPDTTPLQGVPMPVCIDDRAFPFPDASFEVIFVIHALEESTDILALLKELWRITSPEGQIVIAVANRVGLWTRAERTPFGAGRPFSRAQLRHVLELAGFIPVMWSNALFMPFKSSFLTEKYAHRFEQVGRLICPNFSGLILVQAYKRLYARSDKMPVQSHRLSPLINPVLGSSSTSQRVYDPEKKYDKPSS